MIIQTKKNIYCFYKDKYKTFITAPFQLINSVHKYLNDFFSSDNFFIYKNVTLFLKFIWFYKQINENEINKQILITIGKIYGMYRKTLNLLSEPNYEDSFLW